MAVKTKRLSPLVICHKLSSFFRKLIFIQIDILVLNYSQGGYFWKIIKLRPILIPLFSLLCLMYVCNPKCIPCPIFKPVISISFYSHSD